MTYAVSRDGRDLGTYTEEGLTRLLNDGTVLPTDLAFLEKEQRWVPIAELPKGDVAEVEFAQKLETATPLAFVTPVLISINVAVFLAMAIAGVSPADPKPVDLIRWGAVFRPLVAHGEWWRILTAAFVHAGILHLALNMWALLSGGIFTERLFGNRGFITIYLLSAIGGNLASVAWHPLTIAVGASGAIFGVYGALIGLLVVQNKSIPSAAAASLTRNALAFVGYNLIYGVTNSKIDMAAHLGGLVTGLLAGCALAYRPVPAAGGTRLRRCIAVTLVGLALFAAIGLRLRKGDAKQAEAFAIEIYGKSLSVGKNDRIVYSGNATEANARRLAEMLTKIGFMRDRGTFVLYTKDQVGSVVSLIVKEEAWQNPQLASSFNSIGMLITSATGTPLRFRLLDNQREPKQEFIY